jgi:DNA-directed RNA polymerase subunit RPC12/RpoP
MVPPAFSDPPDSISDHEFEQLIQDGIIAVKNGNRAQAKRLLDQAALINNADARIWIWLSATTDDMQERRDYLERAVALDPSNATAKRGLMMVTQKLDETRLMPEGASYPAKETPPVEKATSKTYICPNCGATISYEIDETVLACQFCGFTRKVDEQVVSESVDRPLDEALPTTRAHRWAESQAQVTCEQCGVTILLPPGQTADSCPYCASNRFITSSSLVEMVDPQAIGLFKVDVEGAGGSIKSWLGKGMLSPDNLSDQHAGMQLHPAYYPFWIFEGTLEVPWFCDVNVGTGKIPQWEAHSGSQFEMFKDVIIPGLRKMSLTDLAAIEPFNLDDLVNFSPDYLAGWATLTYDFPLADASLRAREKVQNKVKRTISSLVEPNRPKRNFSTGAGKWSGLTYKLALLPIYLGNYAFQGKRYRLLVNGQTGKVSGKKPMDTLKLVMFSVAGIILLILILVILSLLWRAITG